MMLTASLLVCVMIALSGADDDATAAPTTSSPAEPWKDFKGRSFLFVETLFSWAEAEQNCLEKKAHLAAVHSFEEYQFIQGMIQTTTLSFPETWLGASNCQQQDTWLWSDGSHFSYSFWCILEPDNELANRCLQMNAGANSCWDNTNCTTALPSVCAM